MDNGGQISPVVTLPEVAEFLKVSEKTILRLLQEGEFPGFKVSNQWRFHRDDIETWMRVRRSGGLTESVGNTRTPAENPAGITMESLAEEKWIFPGIPVMRREDALVTLANKLVENHIVPDVADFVDGLLSRERLASTSLGRGVALPHLRRPEQFPVTKPILMIATCPGGIEWNAPDGGKAHLIIMPIAGNETLHLRILSSISLFLNQHDRMIDSLVAGKTSAAIYSLLLSDYR